MPETTARNQLPLLAAGQAQKEITHNESLTLIDALVSPVVQSIAPASLPVSPQIGQCWIAGAGSSGAWIGKDLAIAIWTTGGWRFVGAYSGLAVWSVADAMMVRFDGAAWIKGSENATTYNVQGVRVLGMRQSPITGPTGGATIDQEARVGLNAVLVALRNHGLIAP
jgi:hypothetical protein